MPRKHSETKEKSESFSFRMKIGEDEVEIRGTHEEVTKTLENLQSLVTNIHKAFEDLKPKTVATLTVKTEAQPKPANDETAQGFPTINPTSNSVDAVVQVLQTDWGKWRPRTEAELKEAMKSNGLNISDHVLSHTLEAFAKKGVVRRWNTNTGFVYILAEEKDLKMKEKAR